MSINKIGGLHAYYPTPKMEGKEAEAAKKPEVKVEDPGNAVLRQDTFEKSSAEQSVTYKKKGLTNDQVQQLKDAQAQQMESFRQMIQKMIAKQGQQSNLSLFGLNLNVTELDSQKAAEAIAPGGEYSVDAVATRIMDMAYALSGGDASKIEELRAAVQEGFKAAGYELGGELPSISQETYKEVMSRFDKWEEEANGAVKTEE